MKATTQVHATDNDMRFQTNRLWDTIEEAPEWGNNTVLIKVGVPGLDWEVTFFVNGSDATLFKLQSQLHDLAGQVEELISPDAMIVVAEETTTEMIDRIGDEPMVMTEQDGEGM